MKKNIILAALLILFACEDNKDDDSSLIGTWELSNMGEFANGDCTGEVDNTGSVSYTHLTLPTKA